MLTSVSETTYPTTNSSNTSTYSVMGGVLNAPSTDTTASDNLAKSILGNNCKKVDITANGVLNDLATPNMNTYSMNSTTNSSTLFSMEVDEIGNMTKFNGYDFNWNGRRLESISQDGVELISYKYNIDGQRVSKTVGGTTTEYFYNGDILAGQKTGDDVLIFMYDNNGDVFGFTYNGTPYYYIKNAQNDVYMIVDETGVAQVLYMYDAWGRIGCYDATNFGLATINPLMYRSYYLDVETGYHFYYLNSRYYLADLGRFISADSVVSEVGGDVLGYNLFAYCQNNPINMSDADGNWPKWVTKAIVVATVAIAVVTAVVVTVATFGAGSVAGVAAITTGLTLAAKATEVVSLQIKKNKSENKKISEQKDSTETELISNKQITINSIELLYDNGASIMLPTPIFKIASIAVKDRIGEVIAPLFRGHSSFKYMLSSPGAKSQYIFAAIAWGQTLYSVFCEDPEQRANDRGITLQ